MKIEHVAPEDIEKRSFEIISEELERRGAAIPADKAFVVKRAIHTTADFDFADSLVFSPNAIPTFAALVREGAVIDRADIIDIAPTLSRIMGQKMAGADGSCLDALLKAD